MKWANNITTVLEKVQQRHFFIHHLMKFSVSHLVLKRFSSAIVESVLASSVTDRFPYASSFCKTRLQKLRRSPKQRNHTPSGKITADLKHPSKHLCHHRSTMGSSPPELICQRHSFFPDVIHFLSHPSPPLTFSDEYTLCSTHSCYLLPHVLSLCNLSMCCLLFDVGFL